MMKEIGRIVTDSRGTEKPVYSTYTPPAPEKNTISFPDKKQIGVDWRRNFQAITEVTRLVKEAEIVQEEGTYQVKLDRPDIPYAIGFNFSDGHIGSYTTDHERIKWLFDLVLATPNSFLVDTGDTFNDGIWGGLQHEDVMPAYMQTFTVDDIARELGDKYAACVIGNHPEWLFQAAGIKPEVLFARQIKGPVFPGMGLLHLKVGDQEYNWALAHNYWGKSKLNIHNVCRRLREVEYPEADIVTVGHEHIWGFMKERAGDKEVLYIRPGTAKTQDRWARIHGISKRGQDFGVAVIFSAKEKQFEAFPIEEAVKQMELRRKIAEMG